MSLEKYLKDLADDSKALKHSGLVQLSGLSTEELAEFNTGWKHLTHSRKRAVISRMVDLCEDNLELDFSPIFRACLTDEDEEVRAQATRGLWECDDRVIIRPLVSLLKSDASVKVRAAVAISLGRFADMAQHGKLLARDAEKVREALLSVVHNENELSEVRRRAIEAVASFNSPEIEQIIEDAYHQEDSKLQQSAIYAMGRSSDAQWLPIVLEEMNHENAGNRYEAANACGQLGDEAAVPNLIRLIKDEDTQVQVSSIHALGAIGGPLAKRALLQCLKLGDEPLEEAAQQALKSLEFDEAPLHFRFDH